MSEQPKHFVVYSEAVVGYQFLVEANNREDAMEKLVAMTFQETRDACVGIVFNGMERPWDAAELTEEELTELNAVARLTEEDTVIQVI